MRMGTQTDCGLHALQGLSLSGLHQARRANTGLQPKDLAHFGRRAPKGPSTLR